MVELYAERGSQLGRGSVKAHAAPAPMTFADHEAVLPRERGRRCEILLRGAVSLRVLLRGQETALGERSALPMLEVGKRRTIQPRPDDDRDPNRLVVGDWAEELVRLRAVPLASRQRRASALFRHHQPPAPVPILSPIIFLPTGEVKADEQSS